MKTSILYSLIALSLSAFAAGCTIIDDGGDDRTSLESVTAQLGSAERRSITRAADTADPTLTIVAERADAGHVMKITVGALTEKYEFAGGLFVPVSEPACFPGREPVEIGFWFGDEGGGIDAQDGTADGLLSADELSATMRSAPAESIDNVILTHVNSLIDLRFGNGVDAAQVADVTIGGVAAYKAPDGYLAIIDPASDGFDVRLTYKGISGYAAVIDRESVQGSDGFVPNCRYTLNMSIDESDRILYVRVMSLAPWADYAKVDVTNIASVTLIELNSPYYSSTDFRILFTDGTTADYKTDADGRCIFEVGGRDSLTIHSIQRFSNGQPDGGRVYIGRKLGGTIKLDFDDAGNLKFRPPIINTSIPIGTYAEFALLNNDTIGRGRLFRQDADIDLLGFAVEDKQNWEPIGSFSNFFEGLFDGDNYKIENLLVDKDGADYVGLFGWSLYLFNIHVASGIVKGRFNVGGVSGMGNTIISCSNSAEIYGKVWVGGVCGESYSEVSGCYNTGNVTGNNTAGGVCGKMRYDNISDCYNLGKIQGLYYCGGVCGEIEEGEIIGCYSAAEITGNPSGGICGRSIKSVITCCFWGAGKSGTGPIVAVGDGDAGTSYEFSATNWPGLLPCPGYWNQDEDGNFDPDGLWESLGSWGGADSTSTYPTLKLENRIIYN